MARTDRARLRTFPIPELAGLFGLLVLLFPRVILFGQVFFERDIHLDWHGQARAFQRALQLGSLPLWNPWVAFGQPMLANPNQQIAYPTTWLLALLPAGPYYVIYVMAHLMLLGLGLVFLSRHLGLSRPSSFGLAVLGVLSGPLLSLLNLWHHLGGAAWLPWTVLAADRCLDRPGARRALLWGVVLGLQVLVGSPEMTVLAIALSAVVVIDRLLSGARLATVLGVGAVAATYALVLSAIQWLPALAAARSTVRWAPALGSRIAWSVHPLDLFEAAWPLLLDRLPLHPEIRGDLFVGREAFLRSIYLGTTTLPVVVAALLGPRRRLRWALLATAVTALVLALGFHTPLFALVTSLPGLRMLRYPVKAMVAVALCWVVLIGMGLETWRGAGPDEPRHPPWKAVAWVALALSIVTGSAAALVAFRPEAMGARLVDPGSALNVLKIVAGIDVETAAATPTYADVLGATARRLALDALLLALLAVLAARRRHLQEDAAGAAAVTVLCLLDLMSAHVGLHAVASRRLFEAEPPVIAALRTTDGSRMWAYNYAPGWNPEWGPAPRNRPFPPTWPSSVVRAVVLDSYPHPTLAAVWGLEGSFGVDALMLFPHHVQRLIDAFARAQGSPARLRLLQLGAVGRVATLHSRGMEDLLPLGQAPALVDRPILVFGVPAPLPRTYAVGQGRIVPDGTIVDALLDPAFDPRREVLLAEGPAQPMPAGFQGTSRVVAAGADRVTLEADLSAPGYVVLVDAYDAGWRATVDGVGAPVLRANGAFRALHLPPGRHRVLLRYRPREVALGAAVSLGALLLGVAATVAGRLYSDRRPNSANSSAGGVTSS
jgi:membrane protein YfhO